MPIVLVSYKPWKLEEPTKCQLSCDSTRKRIGFELGFSYPVKIEIPGSLNVKVDKKIKILDKGEEVEAGRAVQG